MYIGPYSNEGEKIIKLLCQTYGLTCESTIRGSHNFKTCTSLHVTVCVLHNNRSIMRLGVPSYETQTAIVKTDAHDQKFIEPSKFVDDSMTFKRNLYAKSYNGQAKEIMQACYNTLAEMLVGHTIKINDSNISIPDADSFEELKLKLIVSR